MANSVYNYIKTIYTYFIEPLHKSTQDRTIEIVNDYSFSNSTEKIVGCITVKTFDEIASAKTLQANI